MIANIQPTVGVKSPADDRAISAYAARILIASADGNIRARRRVQLTLEVRAPAGDRVINARAARMQAPNADRGERARRRVYPIDLVTA